MKKTVQYLLLIVASLFIMILCRAAVLKILDFKNFQLQLAQSPLLTATSDIISYVIIGTELLVVVLLCFYRTRSMGFLGSSLLMAVFATYIGYVLLVIENPPCTCIGLFEKSSWKENLIYTIIFLGIGLGAYLFQTVQKKNLVKIDICAKSL